MAVSAVRYTKPVLIALLSGSAGDSRCGVGDYSFELAQHLALDAEVHLYYARGHGPAEQPFNKLTSLHLHELPGFSLLTMNSLVRDLRKKGYDIVHLQYPSRGFGKALGPVYLPKKLAGMGSRSRLVLSLHEWTTSHPLRRMAVGEMLPHIDALVVMCEAELNALSGKLGERPVVMLPVGNLLGSRDELEEIWLKAEGKPVPGLPKPTELISREPMSLFHYGLPAKGKQLKLLLEALSLTRKAGVDARLYLGGEFRPGGRRTEELLNWITELNLINAVVRLGHIPQQLLAKTACQYALGVFPFAEGFSTKRSSLVALSQLALPLVVGAGSSEEHPYYAPQKNTAASLSVLLVELLTGRLEQEWVAQIKRQRGYSQRFSFAAIASAHIDLYQRLRRLDI